MGKTFEALERAKQETQEYIPDVSNEPQDREAAASGGSVSNPVTMECCYELRTNLLASRPDGSMRSILFAGTSPGDGSSTLAVNYATLLSQDSGRRVLLVDLNGGHPTPHEDFETDRSQALTDDDFGKGNRAVRIKKAGPGDLYLLLFGRKGVKHTGFSEPDRIDRFFKMVYEKFDDLIIATPSVSGPSEARAFCAKVDGIVLVILSGKTRRQIAIKAKEALENAGGKLLGVVLNRRKYYIPEWIYKRL